MAGASGPAADGLITGEFADKKSGVTYRVFERGGRVWMSYERGGELRGERELEYFIGSGKKGRSYLFSVDGYLFEAPINWYSQERRWNMTPAYTEAREIPDEPAFVFELPELPYQRNAAAHRRDEEQVFGQALFA